MEYLNEIEFDVTQILKDPISLYSRTGQEVSHFIEKEIKKLKSGTLIHISIMKTNPIDYLFVDPALGKLYKMCCNPLGHDIIFYAKTSSQRQNLLKGLLHHHNQRYSHLGSYDQDFLNEKLFIKICINNKIEFLSDLSNVETKVLQTVNENKSILAYDLLGLLKENFDVHCIVSAVEQLRDRKFLYITGAKATETLISVNNKIKNYE